MDYVHEYAAADEVESNDLNGIQRQAAALFQLTGGWRGRRPTLSSDGTNVTVGAHNGCYAGSTQADAVRLPGAGSTNVTLGTLSASTWYYVYAYNSGTYDAPVLTYVVSTVAPDATRCFKSDDGSRVYVGCFYASGASTPRPFRMTNGHYVYDHSSIASCLALSGGAAVSFTDVDLTALLPPHARMALLYALVTSSSTTDGARVRPNGSSNTGTPIYQYATTLWCETDAGQLIEYQKDAANTVSLYVLGFRE